VVRVIVFQIENNKEKLAEELVEIKGELREMVKDIVNQMKL
jgi:hypothetical protein